MAKKNKTSISSHARITLGLPDIQAQLLIVDRLSREYGEPDQAHLQHLADMLSELYTQLQHQKQVTIYRFGSKSRSKSDSE